MTVFFILVQSGDMFPCVLKTTSVVNEKNEINKSN